MEFLHTHVSNRSIELVLSTLESGFLNQGPRVKEFEEQLSEYGLCNPITTNSCTSALHMALECCDVRGKEVVMPAQTFIATGMAVLMAGGTPVLADCDHNGNILFESVKKLVSDQTGAIIVVHWGGIPSDDLFRINREFYIPVIEDAAHAMGASIDNYKIGAISDFTCFSFQAIKMLTTGDGGCICAHKRYGDKLQKMKWFGINKESMKRKEDGSRNVNVDSIGYKYHMNDIAASLGIGNLQTLDKRIKIRAHMARMYDESIYGVDLPKPGKHVRPSWWLYTISVRNRPEFIKAMRSRNIPVTVMDTGTQKNELFKYCRDDLDYQYTFDDQQVCLPIHEKMSYQDTISVIKAVNKGW